MSKPLILIGCHGNRKTYFAKYIQNQLLKSYTLLYNNSFRTLVALLVWLTASGHLDGGRSVTLLTLFLGFRFTASPYLPGVNNGSFCNQKKSNYSVNFRFFRQGYITKTKSKHYQHFNVANGNLDLYLSVTRPTVFTLLKYCK